MPRLPRFTGLAEALKQGADIAIARAASLGATASVLLDKAAGFFSGNVPSAAERLRDIGLSERNAGVEIMRIGIGNKNWLSSVPVQPYLFGDEPGGNRALIGVEFTDTAGNKIIRIGIRDAGNRTPEEMIFEAMESARDIINRYPSKFGGKSANDVDEFNIEIIYAARRF